MLIYCVAFSQNQKPTLVVGIVIDQMRYDLIGKYWNKYSENGFKKIINNGTFCKNTHYDYLNINSAAGMATISCGSYPSEHGIVNKSWFDRISQKEIDCVDDDKFKTIFTRDKVGKSPNLLSSTTWTDELRISTFKMSKVYAVGFKDYASVLLGGKLANASFWFDEDNANWVTSSYYDLPIKTWISEFNSKKFADIYLDRTWQTSYPMEKYVEALEDASDYEHGLAGQNTFPYDLKILRTKFKNYSVLKYTPFANSHTKDFAINLMMNEYLGRDPYTDVLMINFAATGFIGDKFGMQSVELEDAFIKLDKDIAHLISSIEDYVGMENVVIFLTSDRGACENPKWLKDINITTGEFNYKRTSVLLNSYLRAIYGMGNWIDGFYNDEVYLGYFAIDKAKLSVDKVQKSAAQMFVNFDGVSSVIPTMALSGGMQTEVMRKAQNTFYQSRSGDLLVVLDYGWRFQGQTPNSLCDCNSGFNENTHVPLLFYGKKIKKQDVYRAVSMNDLAVTLCFLLDIPLPNKSTGTPIVEVLK